MNKIKVLLIEGEGQERELVSETLTNIDYIDYIGEAENQEEIEHYINEFYPNVIIIGKNLGVNSHSIAQEISNEIEDIAIILIEDELKEDTMYKALFSGAKDVLISPFTASKLVDSVYRTSKLISNQSLVHKDSLIKPRRKKSTKGNVITVFSTKGGVGKTFVSTNLAIALSKDEKSSVCLLDLDLDFGNVALALNIVPRFTILDTIDDIRNIDQDNIESYLLPHDSGVKVLPANARPQINEFINSEHIEIILKALQGAFDYIVVDMPARFYEPVNPAFQAADLLLMVTTPEISAVRNIKASIQTLQDLNFQKSKIKVLLNKADSSKEIKAKDVENTLNQKLYASIAFDYKKAILSLNNGIPITMSKPRSSLARSFNKLAKTINNDLSGVNN